MEALKESEPFPAYYDEPSKTPCRSCGGQMTRGDEECAGICNSCYWQAMANYKAGNYGKPVK